MKFRKKISEFFNNARRYAMLEGHRREGKTLDNWIAKQRHRATLSGRRIEPSIVDATKAQRLPPRAARRNAAKALKMLPGWRDVSNRRAILHRITFAHGVGSRKQHIVVWPSGKMREGVV